MDDIVIEKKNVTSFLVYLLVKRCINDVSRNTSKSVGILYKFREIVKQPLLKQLYFSFSCCQLNYPNIAWARTNKSKLKIIISHNLFYVQI